MGWYCWKKGRSPEPPRRPWEQRQALLFSRSHHQSWGLCLARWVMPRASSLRSAARRRVGVSPASSLFPKYWGSRGRQVFGMVLLQKPTTAAWRCQWSQGLWWPLALARGADPVALPGMGGGRAPSCHQFPAWLGERASAMLLSSESDAGGGSGPGRVACHRPGVPGWGLCSALLQPGGLVSNPALLCCCPQVCRWQSCPTPWCSRLPSCWTPP